MCLFANGDINWISPGEILACSSPVDEEIDQRPTNNSNTQTNSSEKMAKTFASLKVRTVIRLNDRLYDEGVFIRSGIVHRDFFFEDGGVPHGDLVRNFLNFCFEAPKPIAVHCRAGHGRTGTMICLYLFHRYRANIAGLVAWCKICRPNSIIQTQFNFLKKYEAAFLAHVSTTNRAPAKNVNMPLMTMPSNFLKQTGETNILHEAKASAKTSNRNKTVDVNLNSMQKQTFNPKPLGEISLNIQNTNAPSQTKLGNPLQMTPQFTHGEHQRVRTSSIPVKIDPYFHATNPKNPSFIQQHQQALISNPLNKEQKSPTLNSSKSNYKSSNYESRSHEEYGMTTPQQINPQLVQPQTNITNSHSKNELIIERAQSKESSKQNPSPFNSHFQSVDSPFNPLSTPIKRNKLPDQYSHTDKPSDPHKNHTQDRSVQSKPRPVIVSFPSKPMPVLNSANGQAHLKSNNGIPTYLFFSAIESYSSGANKDPLGWGNTQGALQSQSRQTVNLGGDLLKYTSNQNPQNRPPQSPYNFIQIQQRKAPPTNQPPKSPMVEQNKNMSIFSLAQHPNPPIYKRENSKGIVLQVPVVIPKSYLAKN